MYYLHNSIFNSTYIIKQHSVMLLMMLLKFISKQQDMLIYKCAKRNFSPQSICAVIATQSLGHFSCTTRYNVN